MPDLQPYFAKAETVTRWSVYTLFALVPVFFLPLSWVSIQQSKGLLVAVAITIAFLAWVLGAFNLRSFRFPKSPLLMAAALIPAAYIISAFATGFSLEAFAGDGRGQDTVIGFILLYLAFLTSAIVLGGSGVYPALRFLILGACAVLAVQYVHLFAPSFSFGGALVAPAASIVGSWHDLGIFLALVIFIAASLLRTSVFEGYWKPAALVVAVASFALLIVIHLSDIWLGIFGLSAFGAFWKYKNQPPGIALSIRLFGLWLLLALLSIGMYFGGDLVRAALPQSLQVAQIEVRPSWQGTFAVGREVFAEPTQIFFGAGPNTFSSEWGVHKPLSVNETQFWNTDFYYGVGFIPTSLVSTGILGLIAWGAVCVALLWGLYGLYRNPSKTSPLGIALMGSALYLTIFHVLYVPGPAISLLTFLLFGALVAERVFAGGVQEWTVLSSVDSWKGRVVVALLVIAALIVFLGSVQNVRTTLSDILVNRAVADYAQTNDAVKAVRSLSLALTVLPKNDRAHRAGVELGLLRLSQLGSQGVLDERAGAQLQATLAATIQHALTAVSIESGDYQNWLTLARLYGELAGAGVEGAEANARDAYKEAKANNLSSPLPYIGEAQLDLAMGNDVAARANLEAALLRKMNLAAAHFMLSQIDARAGDFPKAEVHARAAVEAAPSDPLGWYNVGTIFYAQGKYSEAAAALEQALSLQNNYANALFLLGLSYQSLNRDEDALRSFKTVLALNPGNTELQELIAGLEKDENATSSPQ